MVISTTNEICSPNMKGPTIMNEYDDTMKDLWLLLDWKRSIMTDYYGKYSKIPKLMSDRYYGRKPRIMRDRYK